MHRSCGIWAVWRDGVANALISREVSGFLAVLDPTAAARGATMHSAALILYFDNNLWGRFNAKHGPSPDFIQFLAGFVRLKKK